MPADASDRKLEIVTDVPERAMVIFAHPDTDYDFEYGAVFRRLIARR